MLLAIILMLLASSVRSADDQVANFGDISSAPGDGEVNQDTLLLLVLQLSQDMKEMKTDVKDVKDDVGDLKDDMSDMKDDVNDVQLDVMSLNQDVSTIQLQLGNSQQSTNPSAGQSEVQTLQEDVEALQEDVVSLKQSSATNQVNTAKLQRNMEESMDELNATIIDLDVDPCYRYGITSASLTWDEARAVCLNGGGDLAHHGVENLNLRWKIATDFGHRATGDYLWFGLRYFAGEWSYLDGRVPSDEDVHWDGGSKPSDETALSNSCARWVSYRSWSADLLTSATDCSYTNSHLYGVCEYYRC